MVLNDIASDQKRLVNRCAGLCLLIVLLGAARNDSTRLGLPDQTETRVSAALNGLQESYTVETAPRLKSIISDLTAGVDVRTIDPPNYIARRRLVVRAWARIFSALDNSYDSSYDIHDRRNTVYICLVPPREADGKQLMSCADPNEVKDPVARATYLAEIAANRQNIRRRTTYSRFHNIDLEATLDLGTQLSAFRAVAPPDAAYLDGLLRSAGLSEKRRSAIDAMF